MTKERALKLYKKFDSLLAEKNVTAYQVAKATDVSTATLSHWKQGIYAPKIDKLERIADYFDVPVTFFID